MSRPKRVFTESELKEENKSLKAEIKRVKADNDTLRITLRKNGINMYGGSILKHGEVCDCTPIYTYKKVIKKYKEFYPKDGCYDCPKCGAPQFCKKCIENYGLKLAKTTRDLI